MRGSSSALFALLASAAALASSVSCADPDFVPPKQSAAKAGAVISEPDAPNIMANAPHRIVSGKSVAVELIR